VNLDGHLQPNFGMDGEFSQCYHLFEHSSILNYNSKITVLTWLCVSRNFLCTLDISKNTALIFLSVSYTNITTLDVSNNMALTELDVRYTKITSLDVYKNTSLIKLYNNIIPKRRQKRYKS
jgi:hypothetical protein